MAKNTNMAKGISSQETIERFVIRARRVEMHSLVKSGDIERYADPKMTFSVSEAGNVSIQHHACTEEEAMESLAGRLRPLIVQSEPIYLSKVLDAILKQVPIGSFTESEAKAFETTKSWFVHRYEKKDSERYGIQLVGQEGDFLTDLLSDALLAESWVYTDTVHADPKGDKAEARKLGYSDRYRAGSSFFCEFACVVISLLNVVRTLSERGLLQLPDSIWNEAVTYAEAEESDREQVVAGSTYVFPVGTKIPAGADPKDIPGARKATPVVMRRLQHPEGAASVASYDENMRQTGSFLAFCDAEGESLVFSIDGIGVLTISEKTMVQGEGPTGSISFTASESNLSETNDFLSSIAPPNWLGLEFMYRGEQLKAVLQLSGSPEQVVREK